MLVAVFPVEALTEACAGVCAAAGTSTGTVLLPDGLGLAGCCAIATEGITTANVNIQRARRLENRERIGLSEESMNQCVRFHRSVAHEE